MNKINKYIAAAGIVGTALMGVSAFAHGPMDANFKGTISAINGNSVTLNLNNATNLKIGDTISLFDQTQAKAEDGDNRAVIGAVGTVNGGTFTVNRQNGQTVTVSTSASTSFKKDGQSGSLSNVVSGAFVMVKGAFDSATNTITANAVNIFTQARMGLGMHLGWFKHGHGLNTTPSPTPTP